MIGLGANMSAADTSGAFSILNLLGDDNKYKKRLEELVNHAKGAQEHVAKAQALHDEVAKKSKEAEAKLAEAKRMAEAANERELHVDQYYALLDAKAKVLDRREQDIIEKGDRHFKEREAALAKAVVEAEARRKALDEKEHQLQQLRLTLDDDEKKKIADHNRRLAVLLEKEVFHKTEVSKVADLRSELEAKLAKLKHAVSSI